MDTDPEHYYKRMIRISKLALRGATTLKSSRTIKLRSLGKTILAIGDEVKAIRRLLVDKPRIEAEVKAVKKSLVDKPRKKNKSRPKRKIR